MNSPQREARVFETVATRPIDLDILKIGRTGPMAEFVLALSPGGRNDHLVHTVMCMRLIFFMNIHKNHCLGGAC